MYENIKLIDKADKVLNKAFVNKWQVKLFLKASKCKTLEDVCNYPLEDITKIKGLGLSFKNNLESFLKIHLKLKVTSAVISEKEYILIKNDILNFLKAHCNDNFGRNWFDITQFNKAYLLTKFKRTHLIERSSTRAYTDDVLDTVFDRMVNDKYILPESKTKNNPSYTLNYYTYQEKIPLTEDPSGYCGYMLNPQYGTIEYTSDIHYYNTAEYKKSIKNFDELNLLNLYEKLASKIIFNSFSRCVKDKLLDLSIFHYADLLLINKKRLLSNFNKKQISFILAHLQKLGLSLDLTFKKSELVKICNIINKKEKIEIKLMNFIWTLFDLRSYTLDNPLTYNIYGRSSKLDKKYLNNSILNNYIRYWNSSTLIFNESIVDDIDNLLFLHRIKPII